MNKSQILDFKIIEYTICLNYDLFAIFLKKLSFLVNYATILCSLSPSIQCVT